MAMAQATKTMDLIAFKVDASNWREESKVRLWPNVAVWAADRKGPKASVGLAESGRCHDHSLWRLKAVARERLDNARS